jgi:hypothetical protein
MGSKAGHMESRVKEQAAKMNRFQRQHTGMERRFNPDSRWVFTLTPSPQLRSPSNEYTLTLRGRIPADRLMEILRRVEGEIDAAFIR